MEEKVLFLVVIALLVFAGFSVYNNRQGEVSGFQVKNPYITDKIQTNNILSLIDTPADPVVLSMTVGTDGLPLIAYLDLVTLGNALKVAKCNNKVCSSSDETYVEVGEIGPTGFSPGNLVSIATGNDGLPIISHEKVYGVPVTKSELEVIKCDNILCNSNTKTTILSVPNLLFGSNALTVGIDGLPVIAYSLSNTLYFVKCGNTACSSSNSLPVIIDTPNSGAYLSMMVGSDGFPIMAYIAVPSQNNMEVRVAKCNDVYCLDPPTINIISATGAGKTSIVLGTDGLPVILHGASIYKCNDLTCSPSLITGNVLPFGAKGVDIYNTALAIGSDGFPVAIVGGALGSMIRVFKCGDLACNYVKSTSIVDSVEPVNPGSWIREQEIVVTPDGLPFIAYRFYQSGQQWINALKGAKCGNPGCTR